jgi:uncharacterized protein YndB with AHSA1/START domain
MSTDRIHKEILLRAPLERVWQAISEAQQFGKWFGISFNGPFTAGAQLTGKITCTTVDAEVARLQKPFEGKPVAFWVEKIEPMHSISFRWHPHATDPNLDYSKEPTTLIEFRLRPEGKNTHLTITESGFDKIPLERRAEAFKANDSGWSHQTKLIEKYLALHIKT